RDTAWVLVAPPDFAPAVDNLVTLYDVLREVAVGKGWITPPDAISFTRDVYPIFSRIVSYQWVNASSLRGHGPGRPGNFLDPNLITALADKTDANKSARHQVFDRIRNPAPATQQESVAQANLQFI